MIQGGHCLTQLARVSLESTPFNAPHMLLCYIMTIMMIWQSMAIEKFPFAFYALAHVWWLYGSFNIVKVNCSGQVCLSPSYEAFGTPGKKDQLHQYHQQLPI